MYVTAISRDFEFAVAPEEVRDGEVTSALKAGPLPRLARVTAAGEDSDG